MTDTLVLPDDVAITVGSALEETARVLTAQFGSGYAQRSGDGLNTVSGQYTVIFEHLSRPQAETIRQFFKDQGGYKGFYFTVPGESAPRLWRCEKWSKAHVIYERETLNATFIEVFTP